MKPLLLGLLLGTALVLLWRDYQRAMDEIELLEGMLDR